VTADNPVESKLKKFRRGQKKGKANGSSAPPLPKRSRPIYSR